MKRIFIKSGPRKGGIKPVPTTSKPDIKPSGQSSIRRCGNRLCCNKEIENGR